MDFAQILDLARDNNEKLKVTGILVVKAKERTRKSKRIRELAVKVAENINIKWLKGHIRTRPLKVESNFAGK